MNPRTPESVAAALHALANEYASGTRPTPRPGQGIERWQGIPLLPVAMHDALCGWRVGTAQDDDGSVMGCAGCGLVYRRAEIVALDS